MSQPSTAIQLDRMITGYWISQAIYAAAKFGIADHLNGGSRSIDELAQSTSTKPDALYRLLRALASVGIFAEGPERQFSLTPLAELLQSDVPGSKRALALMSGDEQFQAWSQIDYSVRTGKPSFDKVFGQPVFEYFGRHQDKARIFDGAMVGIHGREADAVLEAYDFSAFKTVADIGGGNGSQLLGILRQYPTMRGILFDLDHVIEHARDGIESAGVADRCQCVSGSFFESVPPGADAYLMRHIIHDWDDDKSRAILQNCHRAMSGNSRLLIIDSVIPPGNDPFGAKFLDLVMLQIPGGKERTEQEFRDLLDGAGFALDRIVPTSTDASIVEASRKRA